MPYVLVILRRGGNADNQQAYATAHELFIDSLIERNLVLLGGGFAESIDDADAAYLLRCSGVEEARQIAAAVSENPVLDLFSFYGESDYGFTIAQHVGGVDEPWDDFGRMIDRSPGALLHQNTAPLLLLQAEGDLRCPAGQTEIAFTMLRKLGRTVEMVRYPEESHLMLLLGRPDRRVDRLERIVDWFERYL